MKIAPREHVWSGRIGDESLSHTFLFIKLEQKKKERRTKRTESKREREAGEKGGEGERERVAKIHL